MISPLRGRSRRRWAIAALGLALAAGALIAALPWLLRLGVAQRMLAAEGNRILAPSSVGFSTIRVFWFEPSEITNLALRDQHGDPLIRAPRATFEWSLWQILWHRPQSATLTIREGDLDIERSADGTVNLYETLRPVISERPRVRVVIKIPEGRLRFRDPNFPEPVVAEKAAVDLDLGRDSGPITWKIQLQNGEQQPEIRRLHIEGNYSREHVNAAGRHDVAIAFAGERWTWTLANSGLESSGEFTGRFDGRRDSGRLALAADLSISNLVAVGAMLSTDTLHLDAVDVHAKLEGDDQAWNIERLEVLSPILSVDGKGSIPPAPGSGAWLEAKIDLAALAKQLPATLRLRDDLRVEQGSARLRADIQWNAAARTEEWRVHGRVSDLTARHGEKTMRLSEPATVVAQLTRAGGTLNLEQLDAHTSFMSATGRGDVDRGITVSATIDLAAFREQCRDWIDLGAVELAGRGSLEATYKRQGETFQGGADITFENLRASGLPLLEKIERERLTVNAQLSGRATASGWPVSWQELSLLGQTGPTDVRLRVQRAAGTGELSVEGRGQTPLTVAGRPLRLAAEWSAQSRGLAWQAERLALALKRELNEDAGQGPDATIRWRGTGRYEPRTDQLVIESAPEPPGEQGEREIWIAGDHRVTIAGLKSPREARVEAAIKMDLAPVSEWLAPAGQRVSGPLDVSVRAQRERDSWKLGLRAEARDPAHVARDGSRGRLGGDVVVAMAGRYAAKDDRLELTELAIESPYGDIQGAGLVRSPAGLAEVDLKGSLSPDWEALTRLLAAKVEPDARIDGRPSQWQVKGPISQVTALDQLGPLEGQLGVEIEALDVFGMRLKRTPILVRAVSGHLEIDPVETTLNGGRLRVEPELVTDRKGATWLKLGPETQLDGAIVNDEVSHRVLSYVAPVLDGATRVQGRVSVRMADAMFPIAAGPKAQAQIQGDVLFDDVRFMPGPLAEELLAIIQRDGKPLAVLRDPIAVRIAGRKIYQQGLSIPVANLASIGLDGSVDFDRNLDLVAHIGLKPPRKDVPVLTPLLTAARFDLPIGGTLDHPKINGDALKEYWKSVGRDLLGNSLNLGSNALDRLLEGMPGRPLRELLPRRRRAEPPPPPRPGTGDARMGDESDEDAAPDGRHEVRKVPAPATSPPAGRPKALSPEERRQLREQRKRERMEKKAARRAAPPPE